MQDSVTVPGGSLPINQLELDYTNTSVSANVSGYWHTVTVNHQVQWG